jgi:Na+/H+-dicarboxylate symporter
MSTPVEETAQSKKMVTEEIEEEFEQAPASGCGVLSRYPVLSVLFFALVGIGVGVGLSYWEPDDSESKDKTLKWIGLIGDLFIRSLKCVVLPLVFINVVISVVDMMTVGKAGSVGWKTIVLYLITTVVAAILGIISILSFKSLFEEGDFDEAPPASITLGCNKDGSFLSEMADGSLMCTADYASAGDTEFNIVDITSSFVKSTSGAKDDISLSDTVYDGVFTKLVTSNIMGAFVSANFAAVVAFAIAFGVALSRVMDKKKANDRNFIMPFFKELDGVFITLINWIIQVTPFAVLSLIIKAIGSQSDLGNAFSNVGYLAVATIMAMVAHFFVVHCGLFYLVTKTSPVTYLRNLIPAQTMAFACASSAATIPMTLRCVKATGRVPDSVARFVVPLGATVNMDGGAIYFPCACIWLAVLNGISLDVSHYILLVIISTIGSAGTAPVPSASLVLIITAYNTVFNTTGTPEGFSYILAIDWFMDRLRTTLNVTGDAVVAGMVAHICPMDEMVAGEMDQQAKIMEASSEEESADNTAVKEAVMEEVIEEA